MTNLINRIMPIIYGMTKNEENYGSLSPSLRKFLSLNEKKRDEAYGKNKAKYYQRTVNTVQESFRDAVIAYNRLPPEYSRKIDLNVGGLFRR